MNDSKFSKSLQAFWAELRPLSWPKRLEHIWEYYKVHMIYIVAFVLVAAIVVTGFTHKNKDVLLAGILVNINITDSGYYYLHQEFFESQGGQDTGKVVELVETGFSDLGQSNDLEADSRAAMAVIAMVEGKKVDYFLMDKTAIKAVVAYDVFMDLREVFPGEMLLRWQDRLTYAQPEEGEPYPIGIDISATDFGIDCLLGQSPVYFCVASNAPRQETCLLIWEFIMSWDTTRPDKS